MGGSLSQGGINDAITTPKGLWSSQKIAAEIAGAPVGAHDLGGSSHNADTLANLNAKVSDATLDDQDDPRPADEIVETGGPTTLAIGAVADGKFLKRSGSTVVGDDAGTCIHRQESVTTQNITGSDTALTDTLDNTPVSNASVRLFLNGELQLQGAGKDYTISGTTITWLASSGTAVDMDTSDKLEAVYDS